MENRIKKFRAFKLVPLIALGFLTMTTIPSTFAATTGTLTLSGDVGEELSIVITPEAAAETLDILNGVSGTLKVATATETSNLAGGYHITMYSANEGLLKNGAFSTAYQLAYNGGSYTTPPASTSPVTVKTVASQTGKEVNSSNIDIHVTAYAAAPVGTYQDTVTFTIVANP